MWDLNQIFKILIVAESYFLCKFKVTQEQISY